MSSTRTTYFSPARVYWLTRNTVLEAVRQRLFTIIMVLTVFLVGSAVFLREFNFGSSELKFIADFGFGALTFFGSILAIVASAQLFFSEIENRTALTVLAKPVLRAEFVLGKFLGVFAVLLVFSCLVGGALAVVLRMRESALMAADPDAFARARTMAYDSIAVFVGLQWLKFGVIAAFTMLIASFAQTSLFAVITAFLILTICHLQHLAQDAWTRMGNPLARVAARGLGLVFPNFQVFNLGDRVAAGATLPWPLTGRIAAFAIAYVIVLLALASFSFRRREI